MDDELIFPALMTVDEAARVLRLKPAGLRRMLRMGRVKGTYIGRKWVIPADEVRRVIAEGTRPVELAGGRLHPGRVVADRDEDDQRPAVDPDQLRLDLARRPGPGDQARRDPVRGGARIIG